MTEADLYRFKAEVIRSVEYDSFGRVLADVLREEGHAE